MKRGYRRLMQYVDTYCTGVPTLVRLAEVKYPTIVRSPHYNGDHFTNLQSLTTLQTQLTLSLVVRRHAVALVGYVFSPG